MLVRLLFASCLLTLFVFLFPLPQIQAIQQDTQEIVIKGYNNSEDEDFTPRFISQLTTNLDEFNISVREVPSTQAAAISVWQSDDVIGVNISSYSSPVSQISKLLENRSSIVFEITTANQGQAELALIDFATGIALYSFERCEEAEAYFEKAENYFLSQPPSYSRLNNISTIYFYRGNCTLLNGDFEGALPLFEKGLRYEEYDIMIGVEAAANLAWTYLQLGRETDAIALMKRLVKDTKSRGDGLAQTYWEALIARAQLYALMSRYDEAIADVSEAIEWMPVPNHYELRGKMYLNVYEWDLALADFNTIIERYPTYASAYFQRGLLHYSILQSGISMHDEALADFQQYLELAPEGEYAEQATTYSAQIEAELAALED